MAAVDVRPSVMADAYVLAANLRSGDRYEVVSLGLEPRRIIRENFKSGMLRRSYFVDGELAAMSGLCGAMLSDIGYPYLMTTPAIERIRFFFIRRVREEVAEMLQHKLRLEGFVAANYVAACRMLELVGFTLGSQQPMPPHGAMFRSFVMVR